MMKFSILTEHVEQRVSELLPPKMALIFDGCSSSSTYYLEAFASLLSNNICGFEIRLLIYSQLGDECYLDVYEHTDLFIYVLGKDIG